MSQQEGDSKEGEYVETSELSTADKSEQKEKAGLGNFFRVFTYATKADRIYLLIGSSASVGTGVALPLMNIVFGSLVGSFTEYFIPGSGVTVQEFRHGVARNALFIVYLFIGKFILAYIAMFSYRFVGIRLSATLRLAYLRSLFSQPISVLDKKPAGEAANTITNSANVIQVGISEKLSIFIQSVAMIIASFVVAFSYSWLLTLATSSVFVFICMAYSILVPPYIKAQRRVDQADEKASSIASEVFAAVRIVMACGAESRMGSRYNKWVAESRRRALKMTRLQAIHLAPMFFSTYGSYGLSFWFGIRLYHEGHIHSVSNIVIVFSSVMMVITAAGGIVPPLLAVSKAASAATGFFNVLDAEIPNTQGLKEPDVSASEDIALNNVTFAYPSRPNSKVLNGLNINFEKNKVTAIVGPSGSGKSTIIGLIQRWYEINSDATPQLGSEENLEKEGTEIPCAGSVTIGGRNILDTDLKWWRNSTGLVQQEPFVFSDTIYNNIAHGLCGSKLENVDAETKKKLVEDACNEAYADEFIRKLPDGYETQVGESGIKLSGGQRQRIAIARAIIKRPSILLLDEATSSIDVRGERVVQAALDRVSKNRTTITIAHRLSTIKRADKIIVMTKGTVVEQGNHEELLKNKDGTYYGLVHAQELMMTDSLPAEILDDEPKSSTMLDVEDMGEASESPYKSSTSDKAPYKVRGFIRSFGRLLYEQKHRWVLFLLAFLSAMGCGAAYPLQAFLFANIVTAFQLTGSALVHASEHWGLMFFFLALGISIMYMIVEFFANTLAVHVSSTYRQQYFESIIQKPAIFFDQKDNSSGTLTARVANDPVQLQQLLGSNMAMVYVAIFQVIGSISIAFAYGWKLTLVSLFASMPIIFAAGFYRVQYEIQFERMNAEVFAESSQFASEAIGAYRTVTSLTLEDMIINRYATLLKGHVSKAFKKGRYATLLFALSDSISLLCMALTFWYGGRLLGNHEYTSVQFFVIYVAIIQGSQAAGQWSSFGPNIAQASAAANRILAFRDEAEKKDTVVKRDGQTGGVKIEFDNVHFTYPTREVSILRGLNLTIEKGQFAAIVGPSGCGKTTIVSLLERFYDIQHGTIRYDDTDIAQVPLSSYRSGVSLVAQEPTLFQGSIRENVMLGVEPSAVTDEEIYSACRDAEIHDFISSLSEGYDTDIGSKGVALSGGQRQRISIARALLRSPQLLLLDEATSSLDSDTERLVQRAFERIGKKHAMTMVVVAHRLATVQNADVIFVLGEGGKLVEKGTHGELLGRKGVYWQMCQAQALDR